MKNDLVVMDNNLIRASYKLTTNEMRLIFVALSQMSKDPDEPIDPNKAYYISKDDFVRLGVEPKNVAREIREACSDLLNRVVVIDTPIGDLHAHWVLNILHFKTEVFERLKREYPNSKNDEEFINTLRMHNVLDSLPMIAKSDENIIARIVFHPNIIPYISQLRQQFTKLNLTDMTGFGSFYSYRIYMMLMQFRNTGFCKIHLDDLRNVLDLNDKYDATKDLKVWVIDTAVDEINEKSPYMVKYNLIKTGRKFTHLELKFKQKKSKQAQIASETPKRDQTEEQPLKPLTEPQIAKYSAILCKLGSLSELAGTMDYPAFANWLGNILRDPKNCNQETVKRVFKALRTETDYSKSKT